MNSRSRWQKHKKELLTSTVFGQNYVDINITPICACGIFNFKADDINRELMHVLWPSSVSQYNINQVLHALSMNYLNWPLASINIQARIDYFLEEKHILSVNCLRCQCFNSCFLGNKGHIILFWIWHDMSVIRSDMFLIV